MSATKRNVVLVAMIVILGRPAAAQADWLLTPFAAPERKLNYGTSIGFMGAGVFGVEIDVGYTPNFFDARMPWTWSATAMSPPSWSTCLPASRWEGQTGGGVRPSVSGGVGLLKSHVDDAAGFFTVNNNDFGIDVGGRGWILQ
jgi:hypothetical protein